MGHFIQIQCGRGSGGPQNNSDQYLRTNHACESRTGDKIIWKQRNNLAWTAGRFLSRVQNEKTDTGHNLSILISFAGD